jgi:hypothetical protein
MGNTCETKSTATTNTESIPVYNHLRLRTPVLRPLKQNQLYIDRKVFVLERFTKDLGMEDPEEEATASTVNSFEFEGHLHSAHFTEESPSPSPSVEDESRVANVNVVC